MYNLAALLVFSLFVSNVFADFNIGLIKFQPEFNNIPSNLKNLKRLSILAKKDGANLIIFGEGAIDGYIDSPNLNSSEIANIWCKPDMISFNGVPCTSVDIVAQSQTKQDIINDLKDFSITNNIHIAFTIPTKDKNNKYYNTAYIIAPTGNTILRYNKINLASFDKGYASPGLNDTPIASLPYGKVGVLICMDGHFPEQFEKFKSRNVNKFISMGYGIIYQDYQTQVQDFKMKGFITDIRFTGFFSEESTNWGLTLHIEPWPQLENMGYSVFSKDGKRKVSYFEYVTIDEAGQIVTQNHKF